MQEYKNIKRRLHKTTIHVVQQSMQRKTTNTKIFHNQDQRQQAKLQHTDSRNQLQNQARN